jgi:hypothetical protein
VQYVKASISYVAFKLGLCGSEEDELGLNDQAKKKGLYKELKISGVLFFAFNGKGGSCV